MLINLFIIFMLNLLFGVAAYLDVKTRIIPNRIVVSILFASIMYFLVNFDSYQWSILHTASLVFANLFWLGAFYLTNGGFGGADAKLFMVVSFLFYPLTYWYFVFFSFVFGLIFGLFVKLFKKDTQSIPFVLPMAVSFIFFSFITLL